jgi:hypothetical protein
MRQFITSSERPRALRTLAAAALLLFAGCGGRAPTEPPRQQPETPPQQPETPQQPEPDAGIAGVSNANSTVCARDAAGTTWCARADAAGAFRITRAAVPPGTGTGDLPPQGQFAVYNVDCRGAGKPVDRSGPQRNGGAWLDVRCTPEGCVAPPSGLLAWYRFDEAGGDTVADFADAAAPSTLRTQGAAARVSGRVLGGLELRGSGYAAGGADKNLGTGDFSIALWIRHGVDGSLSTVLDKRDPGPIRGYHILLYGYEPLIQLADGGAVGGWFNYHSGFESIPDGKWHFLVVTVQRASSKGVRWYYDGVPAGNAGDPTGRQGSLDSASPLLVGRHSFHGSGMRGAVDELQIVNRVLTPDEISTLYTRHSCR